MCVDVNVNVDDIVIKLKNFARLKSNQELYDLM